MSITEPDEDLSRWRRQTQALSDLHTLLTISLTEKLPTLAWIVPAEGGKVVANVPSDLEVPAVVQAWARFIQCGVRVDRDNFLGSRAYRAIGELETGTVVIVQGYVYGDPARRSLYLVSSDTAAAKAQRAERMKLAQAAHTVIFPADGGDGG